MFGLGILNKLRDKKLWWVDVVFYFVISSLIAVIICYVVFAIKISLEKTNITALQAKLATVGTEQQKEMEKIVFEYQKKLNTYAPLIKNHKISSNIFAFLEQNTLPNVWYSRFSVASNGSDIVLSGEAGSVETLSRQTAIFEESEYLKNITVLGTAVGTEGRVTFNLSLSLNPNIISTTTKFVKETEEITIPEEIIQQ